LYEADLSEVRNLDESELTEEMLNKAAQIMNSHGANANQNSNLSCKKIDSLRNTSISNISKPGFYDIVCQVCALCENKGTKFIIVWDSSNSK
jgi:hypothetical protein